MYTNQVPQLYVEDDCIISCPLVAVAQVISLLPFDDGQVTDAIACHTLDVLSCSPLAWCGLRRMRTWGEALAKKRVGCKRMVLGNFGRGKLLSIVAAEVVWST